MRKRDNINLKENIDVILRKNIFVKGKTERIPFSYFFWGRGILMSWEIIFFFLGGEGFLQMINCITLASSNCRSVL